MRPLLTVGLLLLLAVTLASPAIGSREFSAQPLDESLIQRIDVGDVPGRVPTGCTVGNVNPAYWAISNWLAPPEEIKYVFNPVPACGGCPFGYQITGIHVLVQTAGASSIVMGVDLEDAVFPDGPNCPQPGPEDCFGGLYQVNIPGGGLWNINLPITCGCAFLNYTYLLSVHFQSVSGAAPSLVTDNFPSACTSWDNWGTGWYDLVAAFGFPGNLKIWADAVCCEPPVETEAQSWSTLKGLFRN